MSGNLSSRRSPLSQFMSRIRLRRRMTIGECAGKLGLTSSELFRIEACRSNVVVDRADLRGGPDEILLCDGPSPNTVIVSRYDGLPGWGWRAAVLGEVLELEQIFNGAMCNPPFPTDEELEQLRDTLLDLAGRGR